MSKILTTFLVTLLILAGWAGVIIDFRAARNKADTPLQQAEIYMDHGLYQLAIAEYKKALQSDDSQGVWDDLFFAYDERLKEDKSLAYEFITTLTDFELAHGYSLRYSTRLAELYCLTDQDAEAYQELKSASAAGVQSEELTARMQEIRYSTECTLSQYVGFQPVSNGFFAVTDGQNWRRIYRDGSYYNSNYYAYVSQTNAAGIALFVNDNDSRLIDSAGVVQGIFSKDITGAGLYSEALIALCENDVWSYYNRLGEKQCGGYTAASNFSGGRAAVQQDGKWFFINTKGERQGERVFDDLKLSQQKDYAVNSVILAAEQGSYHLYDTALTQISDFSCDNLDLYTGDGWIAFESGGKWGYVDSTGTVKLSPQFAQAKSFCCGLAAICADDSWGFINCAGTTVIAPAYTGADYFNSTGVCLVRGTEPDRAGAYRWQTLKLKIGIIGD